MTDRTQSGDSSSVAQISREELSGLRSKLQHSERSAREKTIKVDALSSRNARLADLLKDARDQLEALKGEVERLGTPPSTYGVVVALGEPVPGDDDTVSTSSTARSRMAQADQLSGAGGTLPGSSSSDIETAEVMTSGRRMLLTISPKVKPEALRPGTVVRLNEALTIVEALPEQTGFGVTATLRDVLSDGERARVVMGNDEEHIVYLSDELRGQRLRGGVSLLVDTKSSFAFEVVPKAEVDELLLEEVPDVSYTEIGGLGRQIEEIRDAIELPFLHQDLYHEFQLSPPKGLLLYGPPGCGKTLIAKAVARSLAEASARHDAGTTEAASEKPVADSDVIPESSFLSIKGPELLNKYVGETERHIRNVFERARDKATDGHPVIVFFDEMDSIFRTRGAGVSSDMETTVVPQLLAEIDGVEDLRNVIIIGASNREDMIDPAILRPGRLDVKIRVRRPNARAGREILGLYLGEDVPVREGREELLDLAVREIYAEGPSTAYVRVEYSDGGHDTLHFRDFVSGATLRNIVDRAKKLAVKEQLATGAVGVGSEHLVEAIRVEFAENEDMPSAAHAEDWARVTGLPGRSRRRVEAVVPLQERTLPGEAAADTAAEEVTA